MELESTYHALRYNSGETGRCVNEQIVIMMELVG
jgi:hypothetical protein